MYPLALGDLGNGGWVEEGLMVSLEATKNPFIVKIPFVFLTLPIHSLLTAILLASRAYP